MKKTTKLISIILAIAMLLSMAPLSFITSAAAEVYASGTLGQYNRTAWTIYDNGLLVIDGKGNSISTKWDSTTASPWKDYADIITRVSFVNCENWECIPEYTFRSLSNLKDVTLPENIEEICQYAFTGTAIETIILPDGLITIGYYAFSSCESLKYININDGVTSIGSSAFYNCSSLKAISIPDSVTSIGQMLFQNCTNLEYVRLSENADKVGGSMFFGCTMLKNVSLPASVTVIGSKAFSNASNLEGVYYHGINEPTTYNPGINNATFSLAPDTMMIYASNDYSGTTMGLKANWENDVQTVTKIDGYFVNVAHTIGGAVKVDKSIVPVGDTVTVDFMAYKNYALDTLTVTDAEDNEIALNGDGNTRTFAMPEGDVTITATFKSTIVPHVHDWTFEVDGTSIKATCANTDGACHNPYQSVVMTKPSSTYFFWNLERTVTVSGMIEDVEIPEVVYTLKSTGERARPFEPGVYVASLTVQGVTATCEYEITKAVIDYTYFDYIAPENLVYDGTPKVAAVVPHDRVAIYIGDVEVLYNGNATPPTNVGSYTVKLNVAESDYYKANSNLSLGGRGGKSFSIAAKDIGDLTYTGLAESYPVGATPDVTIQYNGMTLVKDTDYTVEYADNTGPGTATMTIAGVGNYTGTKTLEFEILDHDHSFTYTASGNTIIATCTTENCTLENADGGYLTISVPADLYADGTTVKEAVVNNQLVESVDYTVTYSTADGSAPKTAGTYTASVTVGGATAAVKFEIIKRSATAENFIYTAPENLVYDGTAKYATVEVSPEITGMGAITVTYYKDGEAVEPINTGTYTVKVSTADSDKYYAINDVELASFTIEKKEITASATVQDKIYDGTTTVDASAIEITFDGLVDGDNVRAESVNAIFSNANAGNNKTVNVSYKAIGEDIDNYEIVEDGASIPGNEYYYIETKANILPKDISDAVITLGTDLTYNGTEQTQAVESVTVDGLEVTYTVSGNTATNVGVYELTVTANSNFTGTKTVLYTVDPDLSGIEGLDQYNVKSTDKADVEYVYNQLDNAETDLASDEKKAEWKEIKDECWQWLKVLETVAYRVESLGNSHLAYDIDTVTSADDAALESLEAEMYLFMRDYRDNMTEEELLKVDNARIETSKLRDRIAETTAEYDRVIALADGYDEATVTSADKDALVQLNDDIYALALTDNVTADELENLENAHNKILRLIDKLTGISDEIKRIIEAVDKYVFESVKSSDYEDVIELIDDINALLDTQNITADERTLLEDLNSKANLLASKIRSTVDEIARITRSVNAYNIDTVKSTDKTDIEKLIARIKKLTDGDNITDSEREQLNGNEDALNALLEKINAVKDEITRIEEAVNAYDEDSVKSTDKADLEQLKTDIKTLTDATNITDDERTKLGELDVKINSLIKKIDDTAAEIERIDEAVNGYDKETVTSDDVPELGKLIEDIKALTDGDNLTEDEKTALEENDKAIDNLIEKLAEVAEEIKRVDEETKSFDIDSVKSTDTEALEQLKVDIQSLIDSGNTTENEKTALGEMIKDIEALEDKVEETENQLEEIKGIENNYNPEKVTSDDKEAIEETLAEIEAVNPDNLTDEQKAEYEEIKSGFDALLDEIEAAENAVSGIGIELEMFDEERVTIFWEDEIEALIAKIDELLADENMGETEKAKLEEYKAECDNLIEIINTPNAYFSMRLFYFVWDALHWLSSHVVFIYNWVLAMF